MIEQTPRKFFRRINLVLALVLVLGIGISAAVYFQGQRINLATVQLVSQDLPTYAEFQELRNQLIEQERHLYEYYASYDESYYYQGFLSARADTQAIIDSLARQFGQIEPLQTLIENQKNIDRLAAEFDENMLLQPSGGTNWVLAREQLVQISQSMRSIAPQIAALTEITAKRVVDSQQHVASHLMSVNGVVVGYGFISLFIALIVSRALKAYLSSSQISQRLALFPKRNPNPIITLNEHNLVTYTNPATKRLLKELDRDVGDVESLLSEELLKLQHQVKRNPQHFARFEYRIDHLTFQCEIHWLQDQKQWDIHLTDVTAQKEAEGKLQLQAYHHPETGLENQYRFHEALEIACQNHTPYTLGLIEIRSFTQLLASATYQQVKDLVKEIGQLLHTACDKLERELELYHIGDKNFALRIPGENCGDAIEHLVNLIQQRLKTSDYASQFTVELDFGFACYPQHGRSVEEMTNNARIALDLSASSVHSHYMLFSEQLGNKVRRQRELQLAIRQAMDEEAFELYFQPQYSLETKRITGAEVLLRWQKDGNFIPPAEFVPLAERSGSIIRLGDWVLNKACEKARQMLDRGYRDMVIAVNISPKQFSSPLFVAKVEQALKQNQLPARNLELEITEGVIFKNESDTIQNLHKLKAMGVMLAIDDFGTGYSSLSYLSRFPIDKLKIDRSFVTQMHTNSADQSIVRTVVDLGNNLNLTLIAEGVEQEEQVQILNSMGCDEIQGYWFSKPLTEEAFIQFVDSRSNRVVALR